MRIKKDFKKKINYKIIDLIGLSNVGYNRSGLFWTAIRGTTRRHVMAQYEKPNQTTNDWH
jgi:hypothetical protein